MYGVPKQAIISQPNRMSVPHICTHIFTWLIKTNVRQIQRGMIHIIHKECVLIHKECVLLESL